MEPVSAHGFHLLDLAQNSTANFSWCLQPPGSAVFLPEGWLHATVNVGDAVGLALQARWSPQQESQDSLEAAAARIVQGFIMSLEERVRVINRLMQVDSFELALEVAQDTAALHQQDLRAFFLAAQASAMMGANEAATQALEEAARRATAIASAARPPVPQLAAAWLLRVAYSLCGPMRSVVAGTKQLHAALQHDPACLDSHLLREELEECERCAADAVCRDEEQ